MFGLTRDGTAKPVARDPILRRTRRTVNRTCSMPNLLNVVTILHNNVLLIVHKYIHTYRHIGLADVDPEDVDNI